MRPTEILKEEHRVILKGLDLLDFFADALDKGTDIDIKDISSMIEFIREFADRCHHAKEEKLLFKYMIDYGMTEKGGPIEVMLFEHDTGRKYVKNMSIAIGGKDIDKAEFVKNARLYTSLLRDHIYKEDNILYVMADSMIDVDGQKRLLDEFERVEKVEIGEGVHNKYHSLVEGLTDKYLNQKRSKIQKM